MHRFVKELQHGVKLSEVKLINQTIFYSINVGKILLRSQNDNVIVKLESIE